MRRLIITGLPCPKEAWEDFFGPSENHTFLPIREVFENCDSPDPREMSRYVTSRIRELKPESLICHDMGVPLTLMSLLRLNKKGESLNTVVTLFNGAFRRVNLLKANHPFRIQFMRSQRAISEVVARGGQVDDGLRPYLSRIRAMYRLIILYGLAEKLSSVAGLNDFAGFSERNYLSCPIQLIASANDPYIPFDSVLQLRDDVRASSFHETSYGHFPYNGDRREIMSSIERFEQAYHQPRPSMPRPTSRAATSRILL